MLTLKWEALDFYGISALYLWYQARQYTTAHVVNIYTFLFSFAPNYI